MTSAAAIGVDVGGSKIAAGLVDRSGLIGPLEVIPTRADEGGHSVLDRSIALARSVAASSSIAAAGIAAAGWVDRSTGRVAGATSLLPAWEGLALGESFEHALGRPTIVVNDVQAMGVAEARIGAGRYWQYCLSIAVGTGIGGAITTKGQLFEGAHGFAGAIGHMPSRVGGPRCSCGRHGCIEATASGPAMAQAFANCARVRPGPGGAEEVTLRAVVAALGAADSPLRACASRVVRAAGSRLGRVMGGLANVLDPEVIIVGGGAAVALGEPFLTALRVGVASAVLPTVRPELVMAELGQASGVVGAGLLALDGQAQPGASGPTKP